MFSWPEPPSKWYALKNWLYLTPITRWRYLAAEKLYIYNKKVFYWKIYDTTSKPE
jgi:hypothetical protein